MDPAVNGRAAGVDADLSSSVPGEFPTHRVPDPDLAHCRGRLLRRCGSRRPRARRAGALGAGPPSPSPESPRSHSGAVLEAARRASCRARSAAAWTSSSADWRASSARRSAALDPLVFFAPAFIGASPCVLSSASRPKRSISSSTRSGRLAANLLVPSITRRSASASISTIRWRASDSNSSHALRPGGLLGLAGPLVGGLIRFLVSRARRPGGAFGQPLGHLLKVPGCGREAFPRPGSNLAIASSRVSRSCLSVPSTRFRSASTWPGLRAGRHPSASKLLAFSSASSRALREASIFWASRRSAFRRVSPALVSISSRASATSRVAWALTA